MNMTDSQPPSSLPTPGRDSVSPPLTPHSPRDDPPLTEEELHHELQSLDLNDSPAPAEEEETRDWDGWGDYEVEIETRESYEVGGGDDDDDDDDGDDDQEGDVTRGFHQFPIRPEAEDCAFYMRTGNCKFGGNCKFNHPLNRKTQITKEKVKEREGFEKPSETECKFYTRTGGCKYGSSCRFAHSGAKTQAPRDKYPVLELNFLGLPIRLGERECPYYMRNGSCKYGTNCRFNHPDPTAVGGSDPPTVFSNGGSTPVQVSSPPSMASWSSPSAINGTGPFVPIVFPPTQVVPTPNAEWNGYQAPVYPLERSMHPTQTYVIGNPATETNIYLHQQQQQIVDEFPERPGQPECSFFMKTGDCKFKSNCKYHHPKNRISMLPPQCVLNDKGLPLRPGQSVCGFYSRYGICKFGPGCKFDHSIQLTSTPSTNDQLSTTLSNSTSHSEARTGESRNGSDHTIQQHV